MSVRKQARLLAFNECFWAAERARLDRPEKVGKRRRCGDVIRWKENNETVDQIKADILALMRKEMPQLDPLLPAKVRPRTK